MTSSLLIKSPKTYLHWWTCVPVLPPGRDHAEYAALKRQWGDPTMNCLRPSGDGWRLASPRGFYVEQREDHIATFLFHIFALFPDYSWVDSLLNCLEIKHSKIIRAKWSYSWEQKPSISSRPSIVDILLCYEDANGQGVVAFEAKRPGGKLSDKDLAGGVKYLELPSLRPYQRKAVVFIVDENDAVRFRAALPGRTVISWQQVALLQIKALNSLPVSPALKERVVAAIAHHYESFGMPVPGSYPALPLAEMDGKAARYDAVRRAKLPDSVERFLLGAEVSVCARKGDMPEPPFPWLEQEPTFIDVGLSKKGDSDRQSTSDREKPLWRLTER